MKFQQHQKEYQNAMFRDISRREALRKMGAGLGGIGLASMLSEKNAGAASSSFESRGPHFAPKAKRIIQLFMPGGPSQVDTFDYKPMLAKHAGERPGLVDRKSLRNTKMGLMPSRSASNNMGSVGNGSAIFSPRPPNALMTSVSFTRCTPTFQNTQAQSS